MVQFIEAAKNFWRPDRVDLYGNPRAMESKFRLRRFEGFLPIIEDICRCKGSCSVIDLGGTEYYWSMVYPRLKSLNLKILMINPDPPKVSHPDIFQYQNGDATKLEEFADGTFDFVHSNSVIEHVGSWSNMQKFAHNVRRLAPQYYVQTPNFWFPIEPHFRSVGFHWLPEQVRYRKVARRAMGFFDQAKDVAAAVALVQSCALIDARQMAELFPDATLSQEKFMGLAKSLIATRTVPPQAAKAQL